MAACSRIRASMHRQKSGVDLGLVYGDSWAFGCLIHEIFNGAFSRPEDLGARGNIPQELKIYKPLMNPNPKGRMDLNTFLQQNFGPGGYFENDFVSVNLFLEQIAIKDSHEKDQFLRKIDTALDTFPIEFSKYKILPELIKALEFGGAGAKALNPILKLGSKLTQEEFDLLIVPIIVKLFASPDRSIRISLCENMGHFITHLSNKTVTEKIFPNLATGFHDISAVIREQTLKSVSLIIPKLSEKIINNDLLRFLAKLQQDEEPGIRTNTTICLGKISKNLNEATRKRVLIPAFLRSLVDPFPPSRNAGLLAISATADYYDPPDIAQKLIPSISPLTLDGEKMIRTQAFKNIESLLKKLETAAAALPDTAIPPPAAAAPRVPGSMPTPPPQSQSSNSEGWAGWAISAVSDKVTNSLMNAAIGGTIGVTGVTPPPRTPVSPPVADAGLKDMSSRSGTSIVTATSVAGGTGTTAGGWDTMNNEGWDEEIPFDDSLWGNAQKETPKAKPILPTKKASSSHGFGQITTTSDATMPRLAGPPKSVASDAPIPRLPPPPGGAAPKPAVNNSGWDDDDWGLGSTTTNTAASILPRKSLSTTSPSPVAAFGTGGGAGGGGGWDDWAGGGNDGWDSVGGAQKVSPMNRPISPTGSLSSLDSRGADREAEKERRRQKMAELREARKASKLGAKKI
ncbi:hypothetical protein HK097_003408 [Rhizophlyctis rosea]|uniref:Uncharacterized protein n=1 Tax=Rhizophlyctis rosea TaxID=64517 RepID=A0AAD5X8I3_9FUNG|nr:hypothetical protein HK097_003408 [Rhizophlyctis rosea]